MTDDRARVPGELAALHISDYDRYHPECQGCRTDCLYCEGTHPWPCAVVDLLAVAEKHAALLRDLEALADELAAYELHAGPAHKQAQRDAAERIRAVVEKHR